MSELDELRDRVAMLESENRQLKAPDGSKRSAWLRPTIAAILITVGVILAPVSVIGAWARLELVDTDRFVATLGPLAQDPAVQAMVASEVTAAITTQVDVHGMVGDVADGIRGLGLPHRTEAALGLLEGPAALGIEAMIGDVVSGVVASPRFAGVWTQTLQVAHAEAIAVIQDQPGSALDLAADGTLSLRLGVVVDAVRAEMLDRGVAFAAVIPEIDRELPIVQADSLVQVRAGYQVLTMVGFWLPWAALALIAGGVIVASRRLRALAGAAVGLFAAFGILLLGIAIGRALFLGEVSPSILPADASGAMFDQLTASIRATAVSGMIIAGLLALGSWAAGASRSARAVRAASARVFNRLRAGVRPRAQVSTHSANPLD